jgi:hypothetical protein
MANRGPARPGASGVCVPPHGGHPGQRPSAAYISNQFASKSFQRVRNVSQKNFRDMVLTNVAALMMDSSAGLRKLLFDKVISDSRPLKEFLADPAALERHVPDNMQSA